MTTWQDIGTCPRDGTRFLAFAVRGRKPIMRVTYWRRPEDDQGYTGLGEFNERFWPATHWMPLPEPPPLPSPPSKEGE